MLASAALLCSASGSGAQQPARLTIAAALTDTSAVEANGAAAPSDTFPHARHTKIARPTFWIWLYVSVTGVIVYLMLYHLFPAMAAR